MHATKVGGVDTALRECLRAPSTQAIETDGSQQECNAKLRLSVMFLGKKVSRYDGFAYRPSAQLSAQNGIKNVFSFSIQFTSHVIFFF